MDTHAMHATAMEQVSLLHRSWKRGEDGYHFAYRAAYYESRVALRAYRDAPQELSHNWAIVHRTAAYCAVHAGRPRLARLLYERGLTCGKTMPFWLQAEYARLLVLIKCAEEK